MFFILVILALTAVIWASVQLKLKTLGYINLVGIITAPLYAWWALSTCEGDCGIRIDFLAISVLLAVTVIIFLLRAGLAMIRKNKSEA